MWTAERSATNPLTDEHAAMAFQNFGYFEYKEDARLQLVHEIEKAIAAWTSMCLSSDREEKALAYLRSNPASDSVTIDSVRWQIRSF